MPNIPPLSVSTVVLDGRPFEEGLDLLAEAGARSVEPAFIQGYMPFDEASFGERRGHGVARLLALSGLSIRAVSAHIDLGQPDSAEKLRRRVEFAAAAGARILISNASTQDRADQLRRVIEAVLPDLQRCGITLALENPGHGAAALLPDGARGAEVIMAFGMPEVRMNYDVGNAATYGARKGSAYDDLLAALPVTAHMHLKDIRDAEGDWWFCPVGDGEIGYGTEIDLAKLPAHVPLSLEHPIRLWRPGRGDPTRSDEVPSGQAVVSAVRRALEFVGSARGGSAISVQKENQS